MGLNVGVVIAEFWKNMNYINFNSVRPDLIKKFTIVQLKAWI